MLIIVGFWGNLLYLNKAKKIIEKAEEKFPEYEQQKKIFEQKRRSKLSVRKYFIDYNNCLNGFELNIYLSVENQRIIQTLFLVKKAKHSYLYRYFQLIPILKK